MSGQRVKCYGGEFNPANIAFPKSRKQYSLRNMINRKGILAIIIKLYILLGNISETFLNKRNYSQATEENVGDIFYT